MSRLRRRDRYTVLPEHLVRDRTLSDRAVRLWCLLDRYAGKDEVAFPSRETLSRDLSCSRPSVDRAVSELVDSGWMSKIRRERGGVNEYTLLEKPASGGVITPDDTPPVLTSDDTPLSLVSTPVITGDAQKEASLSDASEKGSITSADADRADVERLCNHLAARIAANGCKRPTVTAKWRTAARLMLDRDGLTEEQVTNAIDWCQASEFWRANILSMPKLRDKYDTLRLQAQREGHSRRNGIDDGRELTDDDRRRMAVLDG